MTTFNDYSAEIIHSLDLFKWPGNVKSLANNRDIVDSIVLQFYNHSSIKTIKIKFWNIAKFSFQQVMLVNDRKATKDTRFDKSWSGDIPVDILKQGDLCFQALANYINQSIFSGQACWNLQKFLQSIKLKIFLIKLTTDLSVSCFSWQRYTND